MRLPIVLSLGLLLALPLAPRAVYAQQREGRMAAPPLRSAEATMPLSRAAAEPAGRGTAADSIVYDDRNAFPDSFVGFGPLANFYAATRYTTPAAFTLTDVRMAYRTENSSSPFAIAVYDDAGGANNPTGGNLLSFSIYNQFSSNGRFGRFTLDPAQPIPPFPAGASFFVVAQFIDVPFPMGTDNSGTGGYTGRCFFSGSGLSGDWTGLLDILGNGQPDVWVIRALGTSGGGGGDAPDINVTPPSLAATLSSGASTTLSLSIANTGAGPLSWSAAATTNFAPEPDGARTSDLPPGAWWTEPEAPPATDLGVLRERVRERGSVAVIAGLEVPFRPEGLLARPDDVARQRQQIAIRQEALLGRLARHDVRSVKRFETVPYLALTVDAAGLEALAADPGVLVVHEDEWQRPSLGESTAIIGAPAAWAAGFTGAGQAVGVLDTGVDAAHPFFGGRTVAEGCFSVNDPGIAESLCPNGQPQQTGAGAASPTRCAGISGCEHGTHVAGIAVGEGSAFSGVARDASLIAVQVFTKIIDPNICGGPQNTPCVLTSTSDQILGLEFVYGLRNSFSIASVNMSLGGGRFTSHCDGDARKPAIDNLRAARVATVIASGNEGYTDSMGAPACISSAFSVGSTQDGSGGTAVDAVSPFSNSASFLDLLAPGQEITSSVFPGGGFGPLSGTSMASPHVAGAWAVLRQQRPGASAQEVFDAIASTGRPIADPRNGVTKPRLQLDAALGGGPGPSWLSVSPASGTTAPGATSALTVSVNAGGLSAGTYTGRVSITSNDPDEATVTVPVTLTVQGGGGGGEAILSYIPPGTPQQTYATEGGGFVHGTNEYGDRAKAVVFPVPSGVSNSLVGVFVYFSARAPTPVLSSYSIRVYNGSADAGPQGPPLYTQTYSVSGMQADGDPNTPSPPTAHPFTTPVQVGSTFFVSVEYPDNYGPADFNIASTEPLGANSPYEWELWSDNAWHNMSDSWYSGANGWHMFIEAAMGGVVANEDGPGAGQRPALEPNHPNPFAPATAIRYTLPRAGEVRLEVFDALGRRVATLAEGERPAGAHEVTWDASGFAGGVYLYRLSAGGTVETRRMLLLR